MLLQSKLNCKHFTNRFTRHFICTPVSGCPSIFLLRDEVSGLYGVVLRGEGCQPVSAGACGLGISIFERGRKKLKLLLGLAEKHALFASGAIECLLCGSLQNVRDFAVCFIFH